MVPTNLRPVPVDRQPKMFGTQHQSWNFKIELYSCPLLGLCSGCSKNSLRRSHPALSGAYAMEDAMKLSVILLTLAFMGVAFAGQTTPASDKKEATADTKETRWQGHIVRINKEKSSLSVRGGQKNMESMERQFFSIARPNGPSRASRRT